MQTNEYVFARIKNIFENDQGELELFLFVGLTKVSLIEQGASYKKNVKLVLTKSIEMKAKDALPVYLELDNHDLRVIISKSEFEKLEELAEDNEIAFFTHVPHEVEPGLDLE
ncbi:hypothetical protein [Sporosarcina sp. FSL K6-1508]|uniref:hypothetical protein n=1 Tax=Sporosarcina sp. FSL K6-1508 TaxID=2921553 RepID=UPI0030F52696